MPRRDDSPIAAPIAAVPRRQAVDLIDAVVANMRVSLEQLKYSRLAPSRYIVHLHPSEYARLEGILPRLRQETIRALVEAIDELNRTPLLQQYTRGLLGHHQVPVENAGTDWLVEYVPDAEGDIEEGGLAVDSELVVPAIPSWAWARERAA